MKFGSSALSVGGASRVLAPLVEATRRYVLEASKLHGDDIPVPVLAPGNGQTKTGRLWTYVRDDRSGGRRGSSGRYGLPILRIAKENIRNNI